MLCVYLRGAQLITFYFGQKWNINIFKILEFLDLCLEFLCTHTPPKTDTHAYVCVVCMSVYIYIHIYILT